MRCISVSSHFVSNNIGRQLIMSMFHKNRLSTMLKEAETGIKNRVCFVILSSSKQYITVRNNIILDRITKKTFMVNLTIWIHWRSRPKLIYLVFFKIYVCLQVRYSLPVVLQQALNPVPSCLDVVSANARLKVEMVGKIQHGT